MTACPRIVITPGEPAGIGPDITIKIAQQKWPAQLIAIADPELLLARAKLLQLPLSLKEIDFTKAPTLHEPGTLYISPIKLAEPVMAGKLNPANAQYVKQTLQTAAEYCLQKKAQAIVTGPVNKSILCNAGIPFSGHTEFFAEYCKSAQVMMLFAAAQLKVALVTTHLPLSQVPQAITQQKIISALTLLHSELKNRFNIANPIILVCGLNPHAGEMGHLGREEIDIIQPAIQHCINQKMDIRGALPADTIFTEKYLAIADAILAMYHDQALPVVKYLGFGKAVNITLGLPIIRTSVDHGTALDIAGTNLADAGSLASALEMAIHLTKY